MIWSTTMFAQTYCSGVLDMLVLIIIRVIIIIIQCVQGLQIKKKYKNTCISWLHVIIFIPNSDAKKSEK